MKTLLNQVMRDMESGQINVVMAKEGYFLDQPDTIFYDKRISFYLTDRRQANLRMQNNLLLMDLWFVEAQSFVNGVLETKMALSGERLVKRTVVITEIDYVVGHQGRQYVQNNEFLTI